jgi:hypothetical protein
VYDCELPEAPGHSFYNRLSAVLETAGFDRFCEECCASFYHVVEPTPPDRLASN